MTAPDARTSERIRLDRHLIEQGYFASREKAAYAIRAGGVQVDGQTVTRPATPVNADAHIFVSAQSMLRIGRGERKLAGVLEAFGLDCAGKAVLDVGSGAGGFTWQLLQQGARHIYAVDVGTNQLHSDLRSDPRVGVYEQTDIRNLSYLPDSPDLAVVDVSFISVRLVLPHVSRLTRADADFVILFKPQFEVATIERERGGALHERKVQQRIYAAFTNWCTANGFAVKGDIESPVTGKHGNQEVFVHLNSVSTPRPTSCP